MIKYKKIFYSFSPIRGSLTPSWYDTQHIPQNGLKYFDLEDLKENDFCMGVGEFSQSKDKTKIVIDFGGKVRVLDAKAAFNPHSAASGIGSPPSKT